MSAASETSRHLRLLSSPNTSSEQIKSARQNLATLVHEQAEAASRRLGFGWRATELAPSTYEGLLREHKACRYSGLPLRVSTRFCDATIYVDAAANHAMRFWHDTSHVALGLSFHAEDEMELGCYHLAALRSVGFDADTAEHRLLHADTIGQTLCVATLGRFPRNQLKFAVAALEHGVEEAIEMEARGAVDTQMWTPPDGAAA